MIKADCLGAMAAHRGNDGASSLAATEMDLPLQGE